MKTAVIGWMLSFVLALGCTPAPKPGHGGDVPSGEGQQLINGLRGQAYPLEYREGEEPWVVVSFGVIPNPVTGKGPVAVLTQGKQSAYIPVLTNADCADLYKRVTGKTSKLAGKVSTTYSNALAEFEAKTNDR